MEHIMLNINHRNISVLVKKNWTLLYVLREVLDLIGTKCGCETGDCGACKVLIDGEAKNSCTILAKNAVDKEIITIEGLSTGMKLHPIQEAFIEVGAVQCGYCTPGMIMTAKSLLSKTMQPTDDEILEAFSNNLCRCTGYVKIMEAVKLAGSKMQNTEKKEV